MNNKASIKQRYIYKIESSRLRRSKWNLQLSIEGAKESGELISIADSEVLRFIRDINNTTNDETIYNETLKKISELKQNKTKIEDRRRIKELHSQIDEITFVRDYVTVVMRNNSDFDRANKGFSINGIRFKRLLATTGGVKNNTVVYINEALHPEINRRLDNGRDLTKKLVPAKLEAYKALSCSASTPIKFNPLITTKSGGVMPRVAVINDCITSFKADVIKLDINVMETPNVIHDNDYNIEMEANDGFGFISPRLSKNWTEQLDKNHNYISSGFCIRNSFCKGMLFTFDFHEFANNVANKRTFLDAWGNVVNVDNVDIILTTSMLKLHDSYNSMEHYLQNCKDNGYKFSITKIIPKELENQRHLNYQFIQSLKLDDEDICKLVKPTIDDFKKIIKDDYRMALLFLKGTKLHENSILQSNPDIATALMINKDMYNDPFIKTTIHKMLTKKIQDAKVGVLSVRGNFALISGDPYSLAQSMFQLDVTGLLKAGEFYSGYWNERGISTVAGFRAPMTCHNNIRVLNLKNDDDVNHWYKYMNRCVILNSWDTTTHALNGCDFDGDSLLTTDNPTILGGIVETKAIVCVQDSTEKVVPTEDDFITSNKNGFGDEIGSVTNKITSMFTVKAQYEEDSPEYQELEQRIMWGQHYQQMAIDKIKGVIGASVPKEWCSYYANMSNKEDTKEDKVKKKFNISVLADKKPYFMSYIYPHEMKEYNQYMKDVNRNSLVRFGKDINELLAKKNRTKDENTFIKYYNIKMPLNTYPCLMNKICFKVEQETNGLLSKSKLIDEKFNPSILKNDSVEYAKSTYKRVKELHDLYKHETQKYMVRASDIRYGDSVTVENRRKVFANNFKNKALELCNDEDELCNIVVDLCYTTNESKQFAWDLCGQTIINNLLRKSNGSLTYPVMDDSGDIEFGGMRFSMKTTYVNKGDFDAECDR